jgi:cytochrome c-type biogenesis protein CcmH/NrfG
MKKETIITAIIFLAVGFLAGYITDAQLHWNGAAKAVAQASADMPPASAPSQGGSMPGGAPAQQGLPPGHPSIDGTAIIEQLQNQAQQNPSDPAPRLKLANYLYDQKLYDKAIEWYENALALDAKNVDARTDLGTALFYTGRSKDALREYQKALALDPRHEATILNTIVVNLEGLHDVAAAQKAWDRLNQINPNNSALPDLKQKIDQARAQGGAGSK